MISDLISDLFMLALVLLSIVVFAVYAWRYKHIWLAACIVPLLWFAYYYVLQTISLDAASRAVMLLFRPTLALLFIFLTAFVARDRVDRFILFVFWCVLLCVYEYARKVKGVFRR
ncbi:hypothetical protein ANRL1_04834 [Anaerolineae bacterium]|nr:hypothetical protein ANRL1_04834 [Anaerolineae bacterium]